jgi:hypothetical protein
VIGSTGTADTSDLGYRALGSFKSDLGLGTSLTQTANNGNGTAAAPAFTFTGDPDTGIYRPGADALGFVTNGSEKVRIDSAGNVGIGVSSPSARLDVGGGEVRARRMSVFYATAPFEAGNFDIDITSLVSGISNRAKSRTYLVMVSEIQGANQHYVKHLIIRFRESDGLDVRTIDEFGNTSGSNAPATISRPSTNILRFARSTDASFSVNFMNEL